MASVALGLGISLVGGLFKGKPPKPKANPESIIKPTASESGASIPVIIGENRCSSNLIYAYPVRRVLQKGKKRKGQPRDPDQTAYFASFGLGIAWGQYDLLAIYSQQELLWSVDTYPGYDADKSDETEQYFTFYDGDINQAVEPDYITLVGVDNASAFRGLTWIAFKDYPLEKSGNAFPTMEFVIRNKNRSNVATQYTDCLLDLATETGFETVVIDLGEWQADIRGFSIAQDSETTKSALVGACDLSDASLYFEPKSETLYIRSRTGSQVHVLGTSEETVFVANYGHDFTGQSGDRMHKFLINNPSTYARGISFKFLDLNRAYNQSSIRSNRPSKDGRAEENLTISTTAVTTLETAFRLSNLAVRTQWQSQTTFEIVVPVTTLIQPSTTEEITERIKPGDMMQVDLSTFYSRNPKSNPLLGKVYLTIRTIEVGADDTAILKGTLINPAINRWSGANVSVTQNDLIEGNGVDSVTPISSVLLDVNYNKYADSVDYSVMVLTEDEGKDIGQVFISYDGGSNYIDTGLQVLDTVDHGELQTLIPANIFLDNSYTFTLVNTTGEFNSVTNTEFNQGLNAFVLPSGEYIGFRDATLIAPNTWQFTGLYRGIFGTIHLVSNAIPAGTKFYYVNGNSPPVVIPLNNTLLSLGGELRCKLVNIGSNLAATTASVLNPIAYRSNIPYAPINVIYNTTGTTDNWIWVRTDRKFGTTARGSNPTGNAEINESYDVEIYDTVLMTIVDTATVTSPAYSVDRTALGLTTYTITISQNGLLQQGYSITVNYP